jgi:hypothetical protein
MLEETLKLTVGDTIAHIMPMGSTGLEGSDDQDLIAELGDQGDDVNPWRDPPTWPTDVFVTVAHLINISGLLTYFLIPRRPSSGAINLSVLPLL